MERLLNRRVFLRLSGMSVALTLASPVLARRLSSPRRRPEDIPGPRPRPDVQTATPTLVNVFLRGGCDGLNVVIPTDPTEYATYQSYRPTIQVLTADMQAAGTLLTDASGADAHWGLHPNCQPLVQLWNDGRLAVLPDIHYDNGSRSHFDSQQYYDNGTPYNKYTLDGWLNRYLTATDNGSPLLRGLAFDTQTPFALQGTYPTLTLSDLNDLSVCYDPSRNTRYLDTQEAAYPASEASAVKWDPEVAAAGSDLISAIRWIQSVQLPATDAAAAPFYFDPTTEAQKYNKYGYFHDRLKDLAQLIKANVFDISAAEVDLFGWDTHNIQLTEQPGLIETLARGIRAFFEDLGSTYGRNVVLITYSEFGRTSRENGNTGTDHGSATACFVAGDASVVSGRRVYTNWYGLTDLRDGRDLKHSFDYRSVLFEILSRHMGNASPSLFPGYTPQTVGFMT